MDEKKITWRITIRKFEIQLSFNNLPEEFCTPIAEDFGEKNNLKLLGKSHLLKKYWTFRYDRKK